MPLILGGKFLDVTAWTNALEGFIAFGLLASATYLLNDLWDLREDRQHWSKKSRPLAAGEMQIVLSIALIFLLSLGAFSIAFVAASESIALLAIYLGVDLGLFLQVEARTDC